MTSPTLELQSKVVTRMKAYAPLSALIGSRVYDNVPANAVFPYVSIGPEQILQDDADCIESFEISFQIDAWSQAVGFPEVKRVAEEVRVSLHEYELPLIDNALITLTHRQTRIFRDPDGLTNHAALEFIALVEQP